MQSESVEALLLCAHDWQAADPGFDGHAEVAFGGLKLAAIQLTPSPLIDRTSTSESFSSLRSTMRTSESGRRKSARSWRIVSSTPCHVAWRLPPPESFDVPMLWYGSGWTRKRYQLSSCDSIPQPKTPTPPTMSVKSCMYVAPLPITVPLPGALPAFAATDGNQ